MIDSPCHMIFRYKYQLNIPRFFRYFELEIINILNSKGVNWKDEIMEKTQSKNWKDVTPIFNQSNEFGLESFKIKSVCSFHRFFKRYITFCKKHNCEDIFQRYRKANKIRTDVIRNMDVVTLDSMEYIKKVWKDESDLKIIFSLFLNVYGFEFNYMFDFDEASFVIYENHNYKGLIRRIKQIINDSVGNL